ncbi:MAG: hypothetical protein KJZ73_17025 [Pseudorhodoplanes sp.]|nr:hypothetical protein [Pseudorhodoplanes sp.]MBW7948082.1 class I SAM-dependent methyltransferase [Pseudorhodoplanes sp.]MCL4712946.1 hypothetical protein [Pseudorhodoplanes sp.]MCQ3941918.1 hypothetical protein [Alphaproteobacteria bacterium]GIK81030.1 MAG: hypothetical protein BroJett024_21350 [Alphaproteobacteria bacterium]
MSFSASWLALREPYDQAARNAEILDAVAGYFAGQATISAVDLACGTGATLRAIGARLPVRQTWRLIDNDLSLLSRAAPADVSADIVVRTEPIDLVRDLELALDGPVDLVTNSALLDLVSQEWLDRFVVETAARRLPVYAALVYDGCVTFEPALALDPDIVDAVNRHQQTDKGFGPALGPAAAGELIAAFEQIGYETVHGPSDWNFGSADAAIQKEVIAGWAAAARQVGGIPVEKIVDWLERRHRAIAEGRSSIVVGHADVFTRPQALR